MKFRVIVTYKPGILDPQGKTIHHSIEMLGYKEVKDVRSGKYFELEIEGNDKKKAEETLKEISSKLLANPNIQTFKIETDK
ncbi:MAG TPA: phosphoribosylformylglycinamidine synthase subunit PurS [Firmicutes bacterium]|nr:phosphoribosylformylglycinamidine synthase subunit PurS [Bacillota bacterium]